jgi:hypothetical protein
VIIAGVAVSQNQSIGQRRREEEKQLREGMAEGPHLNDFHRGPWKPGPKS